MPRICAGKGEAYQDNISSKQLQLTEHHSPILPPEKEAVNDSNTNTTNTNAKQDATTPTTRA
jgi:hypothetical protein